MFSTLVSAQSNPDVIQKNSDAMDAYANLEIETALRLLKEAEQICIDNNISGPQMARTLVNRGVVEMGGNGDNAVAMEYFKKALCHDSAVMLDPLNSTPEMADLFSGAHAQVKSQGCDGIGPASEAGADSSMDDLLGTPPVGTTPVAPVPEPPTSQPERPVASGVSQPVEVVNDVLRHTSVTEQKRMVPIPFYVVTNSDVDVASVVTFYRTVGERIFQQLPLVQKGDGWSAYIECDVLTTLDPSAIEYYIAVTDESGQLLATAGSEAQPFTIQIGHSISSEPPSVPGEAPLPACQEDCPPWNPDCNARNCGKYAELCSDDEPCCSGMACVDGVCEEAGSQPKGKPGAMTARVRLFVNGGVGLGLVPKEEYTADDFPNKRSVAAIGSDNPGIGFSKLHFRVGAMIPLTEKLEVGANFRGDLPLFAEFYDALVPSIIANVAYRIAGSNAESGFQMYGVAGFGWVQIMHRIPFKDCKSWIELKPGESAEDVVCKYDNWKDISNEQVETTGFRRAGYLGVELGFDMNYWFTRNVGLNVGTIFDITFPKNFTINLDLQMGLALRF
ncbi:MAG: hypothetical protein JXR76_00340 [Deltaproteobacteria bacterium]|nr:hypothetical protein [Deltaproteobacteria bacterium]